MNKNFMAYLLIILGIVLTVSGIVMLTKQPKETVVVHSYDVAPKAKSDTVYMQAQPQERVVEKTVVVEKEVETTPTSAPADDRTEEEIMGQKFEDYVVNLLADSRFRLLDRTMDKKTSEGVYAESCLNPDLHISQAHKPQWLDYYIECKYRTSWYQGQVKLEKYKVDRYKTFQGTERRKVLIALGVGGKPEAPKSLMIVPLDSLENYTIKQDWVLKYRIDATPEGLYNYMSDYFKIVFANSKNKKNGNRYRN
jgi:hypothetical protein